MLLWSHLSPCVNCIFFRLHIFCQLGDAILKHVKSATHLLSSCWLCNSARFQHNVADFYICVLKCLKNIIKWSSTVSILVFSQTRMPSKCAGFWLVCSVRWRATRLSQAKMKYVFSQTNCIAVLSAVLASKYNLCDITALPLTCCLARVLTLRRSSVLKHFSEAGRLAKL